MGFVVAAPQISDRQSEWKQGVFLFSVELMKGELTRDTHYNNQYPWVKAGYDRHTEYPTWFSEKAEYLVYLKRHKTDGWERPTTIAAFRGEWRSDESGRLVGRLFAGREGSKPLDVRTARAVMEALARNEEPSGRDRRAVEAFLRSAVLPEGVVLRPRPVSFDERFKQAEGVAAAVRLGTTRKDIERMFPQEDGGISGPEATRYYLGSEVMVVVPFDRTGRNWGHENRVNGRVKVYRSRMHID